MIGMTQEKKVKGKSIVGCKVDVDKSSRVVETTKDYNVISATIQWKALFQR